MPFVNFYLENCYFEILYGPKLSNYKTYSLYALYADGIHNGEVPCTGTITLLHLVFEFLPFVNFLFEFFAWPDCPNYKSNELETLNDDSTLCVDVHSTRFLTQPLLFPSLLPLF